MQTKICDLRQRQPARFAMIVTLEAHPVKKRSHDDQVVAGNALLERGRDLTAICHSFVGPLVKWMDRRRGNKEREEQADRADRSSVRQRAPENVHG